MIKINDNIWIGTSDNANWTDLDALGISAVLNVARDLKIKRNWGGVEYTQVGLLDGPGNRLSAYYAAILVLHCLIRDRIDLEKESKVMVFDHDGSRALVVVVMYLNLIYPSGTATSWIGGIGWDGWIRKLERRVAPDLLPRPHEVHKEVFDEIDWQLLSELIH